MWFGYYKLFATVPKFDMSNSNDKYRPMPSKLDDSMLPPNSYAHVVFGDKRKANIGNAQTHSVQLKKEVIKI